MSIWITLSPGSNLPHRPRCLPSNRRWHLQRVSTADSQKNARATV